MKVIVSVLTKNTLIQFKNHFQITILIFQIIKQTESTITINITVGAQCNPQTLNDIVTGRANIQYHLQGQKGIYIYIYGTFTYSK